ncbi:hypothetical protein J3458_005715 [Metarhizium acridum]|uniref:uncharacterized protein n=1 Tax=Metarhizium acridum TaxID=92637 RepID=UPI001C6CA2BB|nr:hypothetical protein J3458_005715 [Metarhizium acridum]
MEELRCAAVVSNLEGIRGISFWVEDVAKLATLPGLDRRVGRLEAAAGITPPPPVTEPSWNGLVWRIWRLRNRMPKDAIKEFEAGASVAGADFKSMIPDASGISLQDVQNALDSVRIHGGCPPLAPEVDNDDLRLSYSLQRLCHMAGRKNLYLGAVPVGLVDVYVLAVRLSLHAEVDGHTTATRPPGSWPRFSPLPARPPAKPCCDCCGCYCHSNVVPVPPRQRRRWNRRSSSASSASETSVPRKRPRVAGKTVLLEEEVGERLRVHYFTRFQHDC